MKHKKHAKYEILYTKETVYKIQWEPVIRRPAQLRVELWSTRFFMFLSSEWKLDWLIRPWIYLRNDFFLLLVIQRMTHTNTVTPKELCQLVRDAHSRISASIIKTRWSLIFQQCELEILAISNWITSITIRARTQEFLVSSYCTSTNPWSQDIPGLCLLQQCHPSSLALSSSRWNRQKSFFFELLFTLSPTQQLETNIEHPSGAADRQLQVARGSQQVVQNDTEGGETEDTHSFLILLFRKVNVKSWRGSTEKDCTGRLLGDLKLWQPRAGLHRCHEEVSSSVSFK